MFRNLSIRARIPALAVLPMALSAVIATAGWYGISEMSLAMSRSCGGCILGVWRDQASQEYLFCVRPRKELALQRLFWRRRIRNAVLTIRREVGDRKAPT